jgi:FAD/FMN-containing dehydrogenase
VDLSDLLTQLLGRLMEQHDPLVKDAYFGRPEDFWAIRHSISDGLARLWRCRRFRYLGGPLAQLPALRAELVLLLAEHYPGLRICDFGHCGDGGDHFNLVWPRESGPYDAKVVDAVRQLVYDRVVRRYGGSFSAEHGVGPHNIAYYRRYADPRSACLRRSEASL